MIRSKLKDPAGYMRQWRALPENRERVRKSARRRNGLPDPTRPAPQICECCGRPPSGKRFKTLALDHNHVTGKFRGWLCSTCNTAIGMLGDTLDGVARAIDYLYRNS